jgi:hypothetical protein
VKCRIIVAIAAAVLSLGVAAPAAYADPEFGPGNSSKGPKDGGQLSSPGPDGEHAWLQLGARALKHCVASGCLPEATLLTERTSA